MSKSPELPPSSEITGPMSLGSAVANCLGQARGGIIAERQQSASNALAQLRPLDTDRRVADALRHISGQPPIFRKRTMFPETGPTYSITETAGWRCANEDEQRRGMEAVAFSLRPAPEAKIAQALYELRVVTRGRANRDASEDEAEAIIWTQNLSHFPGDIVLDTLKNWPSREGGQWWPTWHDVLKVVDAAALGRKMLADHIASGACLPRQEMKPTDAEVPAADDAEAWARRDEQAAAARARFAPPPSPMMKPMTEAEFGEWEKDFRSGLKRQDLRLSPAALATFNKDHLDQIAVDDPSAQFDKWQEGQAA